MRRLSALPQYLQERFKQQLAATRERRLTAGGGCPTDTLVSRRVTRGISKSQRLAEEFGRRCTVRGIPEPKTEFQFHPDRKWRFDLAWPAQKVALEIDGGAFIQGGGGHNRGASMRRDQEKLNTAAALGWRVLRFFPERVLGEATFELVKQALT